jgi:hypothetical protein
MAGSELPKDYREIANELIGNQGWRYDPGGPHSKLYPADGSKPIVIVPHTPSKDPRTLKNFIGQVRRSGGQWPPEGK